MKEILDDILSERRKNVILDTDTYNEVDDQFALAYAMLSPKINLLSVNAAPFKNRRAASPEEGMLKSYDEILRIIKLTDPRAEIPVFRGSRAYIADKSTPQPSEAADNIIETVRSSDERVYVVAIGAITNVASALIRCPEIAGRMTVIWLGGHTYENADPYEFNMRQDILGAQYLFDCGVPLVHLPAFGVTSILNTTAAELRECIGGKNALCDYLTNIVATYRGDDTFARSKIIWDIAGVACLTLPEAFTFTVLPTPVITCDGYYATDLTRHPYLYIKRLYRDQIFADVFRRLWDAAR